MTPKVPHVIGADHDQLSTRLGSQVLSVTGLEVKQPQDHTNAILVTFQTLEDFQNKHPYHFALTPPAAAQLSRALRRAVKDYLSGNSETESRLEED